MKYKDFEKILFDDDSDYTPESAEEIDSQDRWTTRFSRVYKQLSTGKFFRLDWERGSTESQYLDHEDCFWGIVEVFPRQVTTTVYFTQKPK